MDSTCLIQLEHHIAVSRWPQHQLWASGSQVYKRIAPKDIQFQTQWLHHELSASGVIKLKKRLESKIPCGEKLDGNQKRSLNIIKSVGNHLIKLVPCRVVA